MNLEHVTSLDHSESHLHVWCFFCIALTQVSCHHMGLELTMWLGRTLNWWPSCLCLVRTIGVHLLSPALCMLDKLCADRATILRLFSILCIFCDTVIFWINSISIIVWIFILLPLQCSPQSAVPVSCQALGSVCQLGQPAEELLGRLCGCKVLAWPYTSQQATLLLVGNSSLVGISKLRCSPLEFYLFYFFVVKVCLTVISLQRPLIFVCLKIHGLVSYVEILYLYP